MVDMDDLIAEKAVYERFDENGNPKYANHTLKNVRTFMQWENTINEAARKKLYYH
jgi:hypothetical protein